MPAFADKAGPVTAGTQGIGADMVRRLARTGASVARTTRTSADRVLVQAPRFQEAS